MSKFRDEIVDEIGDLNDKEEDAVVKALHELGKALDRQIEEYLQRYRSGANRSFVLGMQEARSLAHNLAHDIRRLG